MRGNISIRRSVRGQFNEKIDQLDPIKNGRFIKEIKYTYLIWPT